MKFRRKFANTTLYNIASRSKFLPFFRWFSPIVISRCNELSGAKITIVRALSLSLTISDVYFERGAENGNKAAVRAAKLKQQMIQK